ncbi:MAG: class I SAM-dependent methyltransferase [Dehalococcoidia bacterium]|nr:class I SAM-dependent methyltransferase [Dehalococcoidia bacterium]
MPLRADDVAFLLTPEGARVATEAARGLAEDTAPLALLERLRREVGTEGARAALWLAEGRRSAAPKFPDAHRLYFDRESAEQATSEVVARHTARRFEGARRVADLGCGAGADTLALAGAAPVLAVDRDAGRVALTAANAAARGLQGRVEAVEGDVGALALPAEVDAVWLDPARRDASGRVLDPERWSPSLSETLRIASGVTRAGIKVAPGIDLAAAPAGAEVEFISLDGRLVEAVLWLGEAVTAPRRATVLPPGDSLEGEADAGRTPVGEPGRYLYDLDPSVGRASLVDVLAERLGAWLLSPDVAYLSADQPQDSPFARRFRIEAWLPFSERRLLERLRECGAARVEVMRRASPVETNPLEVRLNRALKAHKAQRAEKPQQARSAGGTQKGDRVLTVALTRAAGQHVAIIAERER